MNPVFKLLLLVCGIIAAVVAAIIGLTENDAKWMFFFGWLAVALGLGSRLP